MKSAEEWARETVRRLPRIGKRETIAGAIRAARNEVLKETVEALLELAGDIKSPAEQKVFRCAVGLMRHRLDREIQR